MADELPDLTETEAAQNARDGYALAVATKRIALLEDVLENLLIGIGMGWDLDGLMARAQDALGESKTPEAPNVD